MTEQHARAVFLLAGIPVIDCWEMVNQYWPNNEHYDEMRRKSPWWLMKTAHGLIRIGWRKRVISIEWADLPIRVDASHPNAITDANVTKFETGIHAYSYGDAVNYLSRLWQVFSYSLNAELTDEKLLELHGVRRHVSMKVES